MRWSISTHILAHNLLWMLQIQSPNWKSGIRNRMIEYEFATSNFERGQKGVEKNQEREDLKLTISGLWSVHPAIFLNFIYVAFDQIEFMRISDLDFGVLDNQNKNYWLRPLSTVLFFETWEHAGQHLRVLLLRPRGRQRPTKADRPESIWLEQSMVEGPWVRIYSSTRWPILLEVWISEVIEENTPG